MCAYKWACTERLSTFGPQGGQLLRIAHCLCCCRPDAAAPAQLYTQLYLSSSWAVSYYAP